MCTYVVRDAPKDQAHVIVPSIIINGCNYFNLISSVESRNLYILNTCVCNTSIAYSIITDF